MSAPRAAQNPSREVRTCFLCGGQRVYLEEPQERLLPHGREKKGYRFQCLDCGKFLFNYQWLVNPDGYTGPSYLDEMLEDPEGNCR